MATLLLLALLVLTVFSMLAGNVWLDQSVAFQQSKQLQQTRLDNAASAVMSFFARNGRLPCAARSSMEPSDCSRPNGWLPLKDLGSVVDPSNKLAVRYVVDPALTAVAGFTSTASGNVVNLLDSCNVLQGRRVDFVLGINSGLANQQAFRVEADDVIARMGSRSSIEKSWLDMYEVLRCESILSASFGVASVLPLGPLAEGERKGNELYTELFGPFNSFAILRDTHAVIKSKSSITNNSSTFAQSGIYLASCLGFCPNFAIAMGLAVDAIPLNVANLVDTVLLEANTAANTVQLFAQIAVMQKQPLWSLDREKTLSGAVRASFDGH